MKVLLLLAVGVVTTLAKEPQGLKEFADGNVQYISALYKELLKAHSGNFLVSPLSIQTVFALVNSGAKGNTAEQISTTLCLPEGEKNVRDVFSSLVATLQANDEYTLINANKIYLADYFKINEHYKNTAVNVFDSEIENIDFGNSQQAAAEINKWAEEKTHDKIKNLVADGTLGSETVAMIINALYFQGTWVTQFTDVVEGNFYLGYKDVVNTYMMEVTGDFNYYESSELKANFLELPYEGDQITMTIVLPHNIDGLSALEERIADVLVAPDYKLEHILVYMPKFKIETTTHLIPVLRAMGITDAFSSSADFSGIGKNEQRLSISNALQKAFIEVDEKGTTAAAVTYLEGDRCFGCNNILKFIADHPFIFYLKHKVSGVFFIGRYSIADKV